MDDDHLLYQLRFGPVVFDELNGCLHVHGRPCEMEPLHLKLLSLLLRSRGQLVSKAVLYAQVWHGQAAGGHRAAAAGEEAGCA